jgi:hypothetical protein
LSAEGAKQNQRVGLAGVETGSFMARIQRFHYQYFRVPGALPQAVTFRAVGALKLIDHRMLRQVCHGRLNGFLVFEVPDSPG